ncbi:alpha/beta hydrolase [Tengunoibacter tsumagoiensis]|uniref:Alpha/beta hydrolase n=1 Tax=Tengunoibacter tsumagoiensis TaxID=2014871 RepID=A0A402A6D8_9CHLR|nr:alpha/beta hydrolase [Tengunoibacter tsumagoiensis]GCE14596.1 alpha/beta hydrolase [Tengunoibacter tsumagoiensis]
MLVVTIVLVCLIVLFALLIALCFYFYHYAIARKPKSALDGNSVLETDPNAELATFDQGWFDQQKFEQLELTSYDGLTLCGYYLPAKVPTTKTVLLAHGYTSRAIPDMGSFAELYHEALGYNVLLPDDRGHGLSQGKYIGFGWHDRLDFLKWIHKAIQIVGPDAQIVLHGLSMGGATVLMTSGEQLPEQVKAIVSDCAYTSISDILTFQLKQTYKLPPFPFIHLTSLICKLRAGYLFGEGSAVRQLAKNTRPILFIHGLEDDFVPTSMVYTLYDACQAPKDQYLVAKAGHGLAFATDTQTYTQRVEDFLTKYISTI